MYLDLPHGSGLRHRPYLVVVHRSGFAVAPPQVVLRRGLPVTRLDRTLVDCWPLLPPAEREIDLRRDALLATVGILVVRFSHRRLTADPAQVRQETLAILASRSRPR